MRLDFSYIMGLFSKKDEEKAVEEEIKNIEKDNEKPLTKADIARKAILERREKEREKLEKLEVKNSIKKAKRKIQALSEKEYRKAIKLEYLNQSGKFLEWNAQNEHGDLLHGSYNGLHLFNIKKGSLTYKLEIDKRAKKDLEKLRWSIKDVHRQRAKTEIKNSVPKEFKSYSSIDLKNLKERADKLIKFNQYEGYIQ